MHRLRIIVQFIALVIVLSHSFVPHKHHEELSLEEDVLEHDNAHSIADYLALAFHFNHYVGQLEEFTPSSDAVPVLNSETCYILNNTCPSIEQPSVIINSGCTEFTPMYCGNFVFHENTLRGPPTLS